MCTNSISSSSELDIDILNTIDDQMDKFDAINILKWRKNKNVL
jgi:hypothetical protein